MTDYSAKAPYPLSEISHIGSTVAAGPKPGIGFLLPWSYQHEGGVTNAIRGLATQCLADDRYRPIALESEWNSSVPREDHWRGITRVRLRLRSPLAEAAPLKAAVSYLAHLPVDLYRLWQLARRYKLVLINRQFPGLDSFNFILLRRLGLYHGKNVLTFQGTDARLVLSTRGVTRSMWRLLLRWSDILVFVSEGLKQEFLTFDPTLAEKATVVHNGVDVHSFLQDVARPLPALELFGVSHRVVLSVGTFEYRKGHDLLIEAFALVLKQRTDARLAIVGRTGPTLNAIQALISQRGLDGYVALVTDLPYDSVASVVRRADVCVLTSRWQKGQYGEGFPLVLAEAGAMGKPVVSSRSTGCDEIIIDGETGRLVDLENVPQLANAILDQLNDRENALRMGSNLQRLVAQQFTWQTAWQKYRQFVEFAR